MDILTLLQRLPEENQPWVAAALRQDSVLWEAVSSPQALGPGGKMALEEARTPDDWSPAALGLAALGAALPLAHFHSLGSLPNELRRQAARAHEHLADETRGTASLLQAILLALALYERRRLSGGWRSLLEGLQRLPGANWKTALACLYGLWPHPEEMLAALLQDASRPEIYSLVVHSVSCQPLSAQAQAALLLRLPADPWRLLSAARLQGPRLAPHLAKEMLQKNAASRPLPGGPGPAGGKAKGELIKVEGVSFPSPRLTPAFCAEGSDNSGYAQDITLLSAAWQRAGLLQAAGQFPAARQALHTAITAQERLQALQIAHRACLLTQDESATPLQVAEAWEQAVQLSPHNETYRMALALGLLDAGRPTEAAAALGGLNGDATSLHPVLTLLRARLAAHNGDAAGAHRLAREILGQLAAPSPASTAPAAGDPPGCNPLPSPAEILSSAASLLPPHEAVQALHLALEKQPSEPGLLIRLAEAWQAAGNPQAARSAARLAHLLVPASLAQRRSLANILEASGAGEEALAEWSALVAHPQAQVSDLLALSTCALHNGQPLRAVEACQQALQHAPENGLGHLLLGHSWTTLGRLPEALQAYQQATILLPDQPEAWLALAAALEKAGRGQHALETLQTAAQAAPQSANIQRALAQACLQANAPTQALAAWQRAAALDPTDPSTQLGLGRTLLSLGHPEEARRSLAAAYAQSPQLPELAYRYAQTVLALDDQPAALPLLRLAAEGEGEMAAHACLLLAETLLRQDAPRDLPAAVGAARRALQLSPQLERAQVILAEALAASGETQAALQAYQAAMETTLAREQPWRGRLGRELGRTALAAGQTSIALAALQEVLQGDPQDLQAHQILAEACMAANLHRNALQAIRAVRQQAGNHLEGLLWCADMLMRLSAAQRNSTAQGATLPQLFGEVCQALQRASELAPERADIRLRLGQAQLSNGARSSASATLASLCTLENVQVVELKQAAEWLLGILKEPHHAIACLQKALALSAVVAKEEGCSVEPSLSEELRLTLARALRAAGDPQGALQVLEEAFLPAPASASVSLHGEKVGLLVALGRADEALAWLRNTPIEDPGLQLQTSLLLRQRGELAQALAYARRAAQGSASRPKNALPIFEAQRLSASLLKALLQPAAARQILGGLPVENDEADEPLLTAIQAATTAWRWEEALRLARQYVEKFPGEPLAHFQLAQIIIQRAETQRLCEDLEVHNHAPGPMALSETAQRACGHALRIAEEKVRRYTASEGQLPAEVHRALSLCRARAQAAFRPDTAATHALAQVLAEIPSGQRSSAVQAAYWAATRHAGLPFPTNAPAAGQAVSPILPLQFALAASQAEVAIRWAQAALENHSQPAATEEGAPAVPQPLLHFLMARLNFRLGRISAAQASVTAALQAWPDEPHWHALAARIASADRDPEQATHCLDQAVHLAPNDVTLVLERAQVALQVSGNIEELALALKLGERATRLAPERATPWLILARAHLRQGNCSNATASAERAAHLAPAEAEAQRLLAEIALQTGEPARAQEYARAALLLQPNDPGASQLLMRSLQALQRPTEALRLLEKSLSHLSPEIRRQLEIERVDLLRQSAGAPVALESAAALAKNYPHEVGVWAALAQSQAECGQLEAAITSAQRALQLQVRQQSAAPASTLPANLYTLLGSLLRRAGQLDQAVYQLSQAVQWDAGHLEAYLELGRTQQERRQHRLALQAYRQAMSLAPYDPRPYLHAGLACKEAKDYAEAESMLRRAADLASHDVSIRRQLAAVVALNLLNGQRRPRASWPVVQIQNAAEAGDDAPPRRNPLNN